MRPLNGEKTHPLTPLALKFLRGMAKYGLPVVSSSVNPGLRNRLLRGGLVVEDRLLSPWKKDRGTGRLVPFLRITDAGRKVVVD